MSLESIVLWFNALPAWGLLLFTAWALVWKGLALWKSSRKNSPIWFVVLLIVNTLGLLEILYIFIFSKMGKKRLVRRHVRKPVSKKKKRR